MHRSPPNTGVVVDFEEEDLVVVGAGTPEESVEGSLRRPSLG